MRAIDKFILHVEHNLFPLNEYSEGEIKFLMNQFREEADDLNIQITDNQLKKYIERFDQLKNSPIQKKWTMDTMRDIERDLKKDDTGLADLDEGVISNIYNKIRNFLIKKNIIQPTTEESIIINYAKLIKWVRTNIYDFLDPGDKKYEIIIKYANKMGIDIDREEASEILQIALSDEMNDLDETL